MEGRKDLRILVTKRLKNYTLKLKEKDELRLPSGNPSTFVFENADNAYITLDAFGLAVSFGVLGLFWCFGSD